MQNLADKIFHNDSIVDSILLSEPAGKNIFDASLSVYSPKNYLLHDLVEYLYRVMYRPCNIASPPKRLARLANLML